MTTTFSSVQVTKSKALKRKAQNMTERKPLEEDPHLITNTFLELDDSRHVMERLDKKKAQAKGNDHPTYKPRAEIRSKKKKEARLRSN